LFRKRFLIRYSVERNGPQLLIKVPISPKPLVLSYKADGKLAGPGPIDVAGQVVVGGAVATTSTGYPAQTQTTMQSRQIDAAEAQNYAGNRCRSPERNGVLSK